MSRVYGGYRERLGPYQVLLDGREAFVSSGYAPGASEDYDAVLFSSTDIQPDVHTLEIVNTGKDPSQAVLDINRVGLAVLSSRPRCSQLRRRLCSKPERLIKVEQRRKISARTGARGILVTLSGPTEARHGIYIIQFLYEQATAAYQGVIKYRTTSHATATLSLNFTVG